MSIVLIVFAFIFVLGPLAKAYAKRMDGEIPNATRLEIARLREEVLALSAQVSRLEEEHSFMVRLLDEGQKPGSLRGERDEPPPTPKSGGS